MTDTLHPYSDFANLPWEKLDPEACTRDWSFRRGGAGLRDEAWAISIPRDPNGDEWDTWELPPPLWAAIRILQKCERQEVQRKLRSVLGV